MARKAMVMLVLMAMHVMSCTAIQYLFTSSDYSLEEDGSTHMDVILQRTGDTPGDTSETSTTTSIALDTECPADCPNMPGANLAVEGNSADYTINTPTLTFGPNVLSLPVSITIHDDNDEEQREYFCLSVADPDARGSVWYTRIVIPWNDNCVNHLSDLDEGGATPDASPGFLIQEYLTGVFGYIGPWENTDTPITIRVEPETSADSGDGKDLNIFLSNIVNTVSSTFVWYGIHIDDSESDDANHANTGAADDTILVEGANGENVGDTLIGSVATNLDLIEADDTTTLELSYDNGVVRLDRTSPSPTDTFTRTDASPLDINHLFVTAADNKFAAWEICGMEPKKLKPVGAKASGQKSKFGPEKAIDDVLWDTSCFISEPDSNGDNWMQIDLGREFDVRTIVILPIPGTVSATLSPDTMNNARVYVGSCRDDDITSNHVCDSDIGTVSNVAGGTQNSLIEVDCPSGTYGRYVYILPNSDSTEFVFCDVFVYGDDEVTTTPLGATGATGSDIGTATQIIFQSGDTRSCSSIGITPDTIDESDETFTLAFTGPSGVNFGERDTATLTVHDDDDEDTVAWAQATYEFNEGIASPTVYISHTGNDAVTVSVQSTASTASAGVDFTPVSLSELTISAQTASYPVQLQLIDDNDDEPAESFYLTLSVISPSSATVTLSQTTITILDNDPTPTTPPPPASGLSDAAIAGVVIVAVVGALVLAIIAGVLFWLWIRRRTGSIPKPPSTSQLAQGQLQGQLPLVPLGYGNNAFGAAPGNFYGYDNSFGNSLNDQNQFGLGFI